MTFPRLKMLLEGRAEVRTEQSREAGYVTAAAMRDPELIDQMLPARPAPAAEGPDEGQWWRDA